MKNNDCERVVDLINQYIDGELNSGDTAFVRAHIENCESCKKLYEELLELGKIFDEAAEEAPTELCEAVMTKIHAEKAIYMKRKKLTRTIGGVAIAAAISLTVLASPAILLVANGGAKAECNDMAEAPSMGRDDYYSAEEMMPECENANTKLEDLLDHTNDGYKVVMDDIEDGKTEPDDDISNAKPSQGNKYDAYLLSGDIASIILTEKTAILGGKEYEYKTSNGQYIMNDDTETLIFEYVKGGKPCFKQVGESND